MSWKDNLLPASFRDVPFCVVVSDFSGGPHQVTHELVGQDTPFIESTGKIPKSFAIDAFILGDDYLETKKRLIDALDQDGPGLLSHPYYGRVTVKSHPYRIVETVDNGRMAILNLQFTLYQELPKPSKIADNTARLTSASSSAFTAISAAFAAVFNTANIAGHVVDAAVNKVYSAINAIRDAKQQAAKFADYKYLMDDIAFQAASLVAEPVLLVENLISAITYNFGAGTDGNPFNLVARISDFWELQGLFEYGDADVLPDNSTVSGAIERANQEAMRKAIQQATATAAVRVCIDLEYTSYEDAMALQVVVLDALEVMAAEVTDDALYVALEELRTSLVYDMEVKAAALPRVQRFTPLVTTNSLLLAHQLYGSIDREQDIVDRNRLRNPAVIGGGVALEVLSNA
jgi:prophage DNA circulation protein